MIHMADQKHRHWRYTPVKDNAKAKAFVFAVELIWIGTILAVALLGH